VGSVGRWPAVVIVGIIAVLTACQEVPTSADVSTGQALFDEHCAACHGPAGDVRRAAQYSEATPDLRRIASESAGGRFPRSALMQVIDGRKVVSGHGRSMPVWGEILGEDNESTEASIRSLVAYIESIQTR
jgi:mono/diheme cytochrome c family protein